MAVIAAPKLNPSERAVTVNGSLTITKSDTDELANVTKFLLVDVAGAVKVTYADGSVDTVTLAAGIWHKMAVKQIWSTGTTATGLHAGN